MKRWLTSALCVAVLAACGDLGDTTDRVTAPDGIARLVVAGVKVDPALNELLATTSPTSRVEVILTYDRAVTNVMRNGGTYFPQMPDSPIAQKLMKGGRFGQLVVPQGFSHLVLPSFGKLAGVYKTELSSAFEEMARITIEDGKLVLDPRPDGGSALPGPSGTF